MKSPIVKKPGDLEIIKNPNKKTTTMAKSKKNQAIDQFSQQAKTALYILGGQAVAAQTNAIVIPMALKDQSPTIQQVARAGIPLAAGVLLAISVKNKYVRPLSLGFGVQGVLEAIRLVMPNANPQEGLSDGSHFVYRDQNGDMKAAVVTPDGKVHTGDETMMLPKAAGQPAISTSNTKQQSKHASNAQLGDWNSSEYTATGMEMEEV